MATISKDTLKFISKLESNNNREWFNDQKTVFKEHDNAFKSFVSSVNDNLNKHDQIDRHKVFRIYRDVRFSKNKLPYKSHFAASFHRLKPELRGGYYLHIQPNDRSFIATGFWGPEKDDLFRIRKELEMDAKGFRNVVNDKSLVDVWGNLKGDELKTAPRDFDKSHPDIDLIKKKQFTFTRNFTDNQVTENDFSSEIDKSFKSIRPFFDYMSEVLTTNLNGESII